MSVKRNSRDVSADYRYQSGITKNSNDLLLKQIPVSKQAMTNANQMYNRQREKFSQLDKNRYNQHKKPSSRNRKFLEEDKPEKIKLTRNVKKDQNGSAFSYMEGRDLSRHSNSLSRNFKDFSLSPAANKRPVVKDPTPKPARTAKNSGHYRNQSIHIYREPNIKKDSSLTIKKNRALSINRIEPDTHLNYKNTLNESCPLSKMLKKDKESKEKFKKEQQDKEDNDQLMMRYKKKDFGEAINYAQEILKRNPNNTNALYVMGLSACMVHKHELTIEAFKKILNKDPYYKKNMYLFISIAYKKLNEPDKACEILSDAMEIFPNFYEAYIYRGKLYLKQKDCEKAINDFSKAVQINSSKCSGYIGLGDTYRLMGDYHTAIQNYSIVISKEAVLFEIICLKRALCYIEIKEYIAAERDIDSILEASPQNCEAMYFKGLCRKNQLDYSNAIIVFEQAIKLNQSESATAKSLHEMALIHVIQKDMYAAYFALDRIEEIPESMVWLIKSQQFLSGAISLIKKKYTEGIDKMNEVKDCEELEAVLRPMVLSYRAYGYFCTGEIQKAVDDYKELETKYKIEGGDVINMYLSQGILCTNNKSFKDASLYFEKARQLEPKKIESTFYISLLNIIAFIEENKEAYESFLKRPKLEHFQAFKKRMILVIYECLETLESTQNTNDSCANLSFYIGLLKLSIGLENEAISNFSTAIDKSEENMAIHFMWKGIALAMCEQYDKALNEFRIALSIEPKNFKAALLKGRCYLFTKEIDRAFYAFKDFIEMEDEESEIQFFIGNFFFFEGQTDNAVQAYKTSLALKCTERALFELCRCYIIDKNLILAQELLEKLNSDYYDEGYIFDFKQLNSLKDTSTGEFYKSLEEMVELEKEIKLGGIIFGQIEMYLYIGLCNFYQKNYELASEYFTKSKLEKYKVNSSEYFEDVGINQMIEMEDQEENEDSTMANNGMSFTKAEINYNIAQAYIMQGKVDLAIERLSEILESNKYKQKVEEYINILKGNNITEEIRSRPYYVEIFSSTNRLCGIYDDVQVTLPKTGVTIVFKLSFCLPLVMPPDPDIRVSFEILKDIKINNVENRPEAPWIKKNEFGQVFTSNVILNEVEEIDSSELFIKRLNDNTNNEDRFNTKMRGNFGLRFNEIKEENIKQKGEKKKSGLQKLMRNLKLDDRTEEQLAKMQKKDKHDDGTKSGNA